MPRPPGPASPLHTGIGTPYFLHLATDEHKRRWLPGIASGELLTVIATTESGIGSGPADGSAWTGAPWPAGGERARRTARGQSVRCLGARSPEDRAWTSGGPRVYLGGDPGVAVR